MKYNFVLSPTACLVDQDRQLLLFSVLWSLVTWYQHVALFQDELKHAVKDMVTKFGPQRYIANLGHGVIRDTDPENVRTFVDSVHIYSEEINANA